MSHSIESANPLSLRGLFPTAEFVGSGDVQFRRCTSDSRDLCTGDLFVALRGTRQDGHEFAHEAVARGAQAVVAERPLGVNVPVCLVANTREAFGRICHALAGQPSHALKVIGVTGTNGKSTTTRLIASVLAAAGHTAGTLGTLGYSDAIDASAAPLTTPSAASLAHWLARMAKNHCSHAVIEVSSHAIAQQRIAGIDFSHVCLTNLRRDHLDYHGSLASYHRTKIELFKYLAPGGMAVVNVDDPASREHVPLLPLGVMTVGMHRPADVTASILERFKSEQTFLLSAGSATVPVRTTMIGDHHVYNCLMAAAVGLAEGLDLAAIAHGLEEIRQLPGRLERIECGQPFGVFVDFAHTPDALATSLATLREVTAGRILCVFGAGGNRDAQKRPAMGRTVEDLADVAIVTTDNPRFEEPAAIAAEILSGFERPADARWIPDRTQAIHYALSLAGADDCVLVAGRGHEEYQIVAHNRLPLDDRDVARRWLYNLEPTSRLGSLMMVGNS